MTHITDPSRYVGRRVGLVDGDRCIPSTVLAVGPRGVVLEGPDGERFVSPAEVHRLRELPYAVPQRHPSGQGANDEGPTSHGIPHGVAGPGPVGPGTP